MTKPYSAEQIIQASHNFVQALESDFPKLLLLNIEHLEEANALKITYSPANSKVERTTIAVIDDLLDKK